MDSLILLVCFNVFSDGPVGRYSHCRLLVYSPSTVCLILYGYKSVLTKFSLVRVCTPDWFNVVAYATFRLKSGQTEFYVLRRLQLKPKAKEIDVR